MKKIAIFAENLYGGGVERILQVILRNFDYEKYDVTLYSSRPEILREGFYPTHLKQGHYFDIIREDTNAFMKTCFLIKNKIKLWVYYHCTPKMFYSMFIRKQFDVAIAFIEGYATRIVSGASEHTKKLSWLHIQLDTFHWTDIAYQNREEELASYQKMFKILCVSQVVKEQADLLFGLYDKTEVLYNPIDTEKICLSAKESIDENKVLNKKRILAIGSLDKRKAHDRMIRVAERMKGDGYNFELLILGKGPEENSLKQYIVEHDLTDYVTMLGYKDNPYPYIASADFYVCSSYAEGYNTAISESLVLGVPVVSTEVSGIREQLGENGEYGIITNNDEQSLYEGVVKMMDDSIRCKYQLKAIERGLFFSLPDSMSKIYQLIEQ